MHSHRIFSTVFNHVLSPKIKGSEQPALLKKLGYSFGGSFIRQTHKAAFFHKTDEPLKIEEYKGKKLKKGEVKIKVKYCALNPRDLVQLQGGPEAKPPLIPGFEVTGVVVERFKGEDLSENLIEVGDKVIALSKSYLGGLSTHCVALEEDVWKFSTLEPKVSAGLIVNYGHALLSLFRRAKINKTKTLLVTADCGGLGLAALDVAANVYKAKVVGVCSTEAKADLMRERGAWSAVKINLDNLRTSVNEVTEKQGVDVVYETVGGDFLKGAMTCVKHEGLVILADVPSADDMISPAQLFNLNTFNLTALSLEQYRQNDLPVYRQAVMDVIELCEQNLVSPYISKIFNLEDVNEAFKYLKDNKIIGKVLVKIPQ